MARPEATLGTDTPPPPSLPASLPAPQEGRAHRRVNSSLLSGRVMRFDPHTLARIAAPPSGVTVHILKESSRARRPVWAWQRQLPSWIRSDTWGRLSRAALMLFRALVRARIKAEDTGALPRGSIGRLVLRTQRSQHAQEVFEARCFDDLLFCRRVFLSGRARFPESPSLDELGTLFDAALSSEGQSADPDCD